VVWMTRKQFVVGSSEIFDAGCCNDSSQLLKHCNSLLPVIGKSDQVMLDGVYHQHMSKVVSNLDNAGLQLTGDNFLLPIQRPTDEEGVYNVVFGGKRAAIETLFSNFQNKFETFHPTNTHSRVGDLESFTVKQKL